MMSWCRDADSEKIGALVTRILWNEIAIHIEPFHTGKIMLWCRDVTHEKMWVFPKLVHTRHFLGKKDRIQASGSVTVDL